MIAIIGRGGGCDVVGDGKDFVGGGGIDVVVVVVSDDSAMKTEGKKKMMMMMAECGDDGVCG